MSKRTERFRGSRTHGRGMKAGRGAGKRGGRGNAGLNKHKFISVVKYDPMHFGRHGFKRPQKSVSHNVSINIRDLVLKLPAMAKDGQVKKRGSGYEVDLEKLGYDKLLGTGGVEYPIYLVVAQTSAKAKEKIEAAGGSITAPGTEED